MRTLQERSFGGGARIAVGALLLWTACDGPTAASPSPVIALAAGDIADCASEDDEATAKLLDTLPGIVLTLGDNVYPVATDETFTRCFAPTWGRHKMRIRPAPGNHDYAESSDAYYNYFGSAAGAFGQGYYSFDFGLWHFIALNTQISTGPDAPQTAWLQADLAGTSRKCTLAYWHEPRFSSGRNGEAIGLQPLWRILYDANADLVLNGHDHLYERFAPQDPAGQRDQVRGIRQFTVGTGGRYLYEFITVRPNSEFRHNTAHGLLRLVLSDGHYHWEFIGVEGNIIDSGDGSCH